MKASRLTVILLQLLGLMNETHSKVAILGTHLVHLTETVHNEQRFEAFCSGDHILIQLSFS